MKFEFTMLNTFAPAYASPVSICASPASNASARFLPVCALTTTSFFTSASLMFRVWSVLELRQVVMVHPEVISFDDGEPFPFVSLHDHSSGPTGLEPCPPSKK